MDGVARHNNGSGLSLAYWLSTRTARAAAEALLAATREAGPIFMYTPFEKTVLRGMADSCPDLRNRLEALVDRLVDLAPIARRHYYHPAMHGSWSLKKLLPTIAPELDYAGLAGVRDGSDAQQAYTEALAPATAPERVEAIRRDLLAYCRQDTLAMVEIARFLEGRHHP